MIRIVAYGLAWAVLFWLAHRADRWFRQRALMKALQRIGFDEGRLT